MHVAWFLLICILCLVFMDGRQIRKLVTVVACLAFVAALVLYAGLHFLPTQPSPVASWEMPPPTQGHDYSQELYGAPPAQQPATPAFDPEAVLNELYGPAPDRQKVQKDIFDTKPEPSPIAQHTQHSQHRRR